MGRKRINIKGNKYDNLLVIGEGYSDSKNFYWELLCDCGETCYATSSDLNRGRRNFCSKCNNIKSYKTALNGLFNNYKRNAHKRNLEFLLDINKFEDLIYGNCNYCHTPPKQIYNKKGLRVEIIYNGIDRINSDIGYVYGNVVTCCKFCNLAKRDFHIDEFLEWLNYIKGNK